MNNVTKQIRLVNRIYNSLLYISETFLLDITACDKI